MSFPPSTTSAYRAGPTEHYTHVRRTSLDKDLPGSSTLRSLIQPRSSSLFVAKRRALSALLAVIFFAILYWFSSWLSGSTNRNARSLWHTTGSGHDRNHEWSPLAHDQFRARVGKLDKQYRGGSGAGGIRSPRREFVFQSSADELGVLVGFLSSFASNALPLHVDPNKSLDPDLVLEFDPRSPTGNEDLQEHVRDVWMQYPVVLMVMTGGPDAKYTHRVVELFTAKYKLKPAPVILEIDRRGDSRVLIPLLQRLTGMSHFPLVIIGGKPILDLKSLFEHDKLGTLESMLKEANVNARKYDDIWAN